MNLQPGCVALVIAALALAPAAEARKKKQAPAPASALDRYVSEATARTSAKQAGTPGSLFSPNARLSDLTRDLRASQVDDVVTILVLDKASAVATGTTATSRKSSANGSITALGGVTRAAGPLANLATLSGNQQIQGQGQTSRQTTISTTLSARVAEVLPNGNLVIEGRKDISINSERQWVSVRGVIRPIDLATDNSIASDRIVDLEIRVNGKGVVGDSVKRPFILYRILLGLLPF